MDYRRYIERLRRLADELNGSDQFTPNVEIERPFAGSEFDELEEAMTRKGIQGVKVWRAFQEFHSIANGFLFQWLYQGGKPVSTKTGSAQIAMVQEIYLPEALPPGREMLFYGQRRVLDQISPDDQVTLQFEKGAAEPRLEYFSDDTGDYHPLKLDFPGYLEALLEARAMYRWQQFFVDDPSFPLTPDKAEEFRRSLKTIFPDSNTDRFKAPSERS
jgi:hypothetical protein